jgi:hypothetical protein
MTNYLIVPGLGNSGPGAFRKPISNIQLTIFTELNKLNGMHLFVKNGLKQWTKNLMN